MSEMLPVFILGVAVGILVSIVPMKLIEIRIKKVSSEAEVMLMEVKRYDSNQGIQ